MKTKSQSASHDSSKMQRADERHWHYQPGDSAAIADQALIGRPDEISFCYKASTAWMEKDR
ncbi:hypothetical protein ACS4RR_017290 [Rhizobium sp. Z1P35]